MTSEIYGPHVDSEGIEWPTQTYHSIINDLNLPDEPHSSSASSTPVNSAISVSTFITNYDVRRLHELEVGRSSVDLRSLEFVEPPNESLVCTICAAPFVMPMELGCEHIFCEDCIYEHLSCGIQSASSCPKCRRQVDTIKPVPRLLHQLLDELEVECPNKSAGCSQNLKRYLVSDHVNLYCDYEDCPCPKSNCNGRIQRRFLERGCLHTHVECDLCGDLVTERDMQDHEDNLCPATVISCEHCRDDLRRDQLDDHISNDCPLVQIHCPGHVVGCTYADARSQARGHIIICPMATMSSFFKDLNDKHVQLQEENKRLRGQVDSLNARLEDLDEKHKKLALSIKKEQRRSMMVETSAASANRIEELQARVEELTTDYNVRLNNATSEAARMHLEFMNSQQQNGQRFYTVNGTLTQLRSQVNHLLANTRPGGGGGTGAGGTAGGLGSGASAGGGVSLDAARREPPKL